MKLVEMIFIITNLNKLIRTKLNKKEEPEIYIDNFFLREKRCNYIFLTSACFVNRFTLQGFNERIFKTCDYRIYTTKIDIINYLATLCFCVGMRIQSVATYATAVLLSF